MTLNTLCTSLPLSKRLKELGMNIDSYFHWKAKGEYPYQYWQIGKLSSLETKKPVGYAYPAPTSSELMEVLPDFILTEDGPGIFILSKANGTYMVRYTTAQTLDAYCIKESKSLADALALLLIHLIENGYYEPRMDTTLVETNGSSGRMGKE